MADSFNEVRAIVKDLLGVDEEKITPESRFREDLQADSLDLVELIMAFEDKFGTEISDEAAQRITTVGEAVKYIDITSRLHGDSTTDAPPPKKK
jgi:acyl carrier protein